MEKMLSLIMIPNLFFNMGIISTPEAEAVETNDRFLYVAENGNDYSAVIWDFQKPF